jgi:microcystin-dependent protein
VTKLVAAVKEALCPPGTIVAFGGTTAPAGWLLCHGQAVTRTGTYANLFTAISTRFGAANGSSFNVPDFRGRFLRGVDGNGGRDPDRFTRTAMKPGGAIQDNVGSVQDDTFKAHAHTYDRMTTSVTAGAADTGSGQYILTAVTANPTATATNSPGGNETRPKNANVNYIIKY